MLMTPKVPSSAPVFLLRLDLFIKQSIFHWPSNKLFKIHIYIPNGTPGSHFPFLQPTVFLIFFISVNGAM